MLTPKEMEILTYISNFKETKCTDLSDFDSEIVSKLINDKLILQLSAISFPMTFGSSSNKKNIYYQLSSEAKELLN